jgi:replication factor C subunit 2/4
MDEIASQTEVVSVLRKALTSDNLPHLLFYGPPGTGKTSTILALARDLWGPVLSRSRILELNASDERGIAVVREKVKLFAKVTANEKVPGYPCPPFKLIILDEADALTNDAQTALRRIIESSSRTTRFCLICNYVSRIIDPLTSRCAKFRFRAVGAEDGLAKLKDIAKAEKVQIDEAVLAKILAVSGGDLRRAIGLLQSCQRLHRPDYPINARLVNELAGVVPEELVAEALALVKAAPSNELVEFVQHKLVIAGFPAGQFLEQFCRLLLAAEGIPELAKAALAVLMGGVDFALTEGADEHLQLLHLLLTTKSMINAKTIDI